MLMGKVESGIDFNQLNTWLLKCWKIFVHSKVLTILVLNLLIQVDEFVRWKLLWRIFKRKSGSWIKAGKIIWLVVQIIKFDFHYMSFCLNCLQVFYGVKADAGVEEHPAITEIKVREVIKHLLQISREVPIVKVR